MTNEGTISEQKPINKKDIFLFYIIIYTQKIEFFGIAFNIGGHAPLIVVFVKPSSFLTHFKHDARAKSKFC